MCPCALFCWHLRYVKGPSPFASHCLVITFFVHFVCTCSVHCPHIICAHHLHHHPHGNTKQTAHTQLSHDYNDLCSSSSLISPAINTRKDPPTHPARTCTHARANTTRTGDIVLPSPSWGCVKALRCQWLHSRDGKPSTTMLPEPHT